MSLNSSKTPDDSTLSPDVTKLSGFTGSTTTFLRADATFATPSTSGGSGVTTTGTIVTTSIVFFSGTNTVTSGNLSGDAVTAGAGVVTLATTGVAAGTYGSSTESAVVSVNTKGLVTTISTVAISTSGGGSGITQLTGDVLAGPGSGSVAATLSTTGVAAGQYGSATQSAVIDVDAKGRITTISTATISGSGSIGDLLDFKYVRKATTQTTASTVFTNDTALFWTTNANEKWEFEVVVFVLSTSSTPDFSCSLSIPSGTFAAGTFMLAANATANSGNVLVGASTTATTATAYSGAAMVANLPLIGMLKGVVSVGATSGTTQFRFAQNVASTIQIQVLGESYIIARRVL